MAQPDFSEFSFGYGVTRYFEELYGARRVLPNFPTQNEEQTADTMSICSPTVYRSSSSSSGRKS
jgi:hypothetical protein